MATVHLCGLATITPTGVLDSGLQWTQVSGPPVTLAGATKPWPSFTAPRTAGDLVFELTAGGVAATADRVTVHVRPTETNLPPVAKGNGPLNAPSGQVDMAATATTDPDGTTQLFFRWAQTAGAGLPLTNASAVTSSTTLPAGNETYTFAVIAHDGLQYGSPDLESVRNSGYIGLPIALAGPDQKVNQGTTVPVTVTLDGRQSARTDGGTGLTYAWTQISGKDWFDVTTSPLAWDPTIALPKFRLPLDVSSLASARTLTFQLVVTGGALTSNPDFVTVTIDRLPSNGKPVVSAQVSDAAPLGGQTVTLTGTASDNENDPMTYEWKQVSGPAVVLQPSATAIAPAFAAPASGTVVFTFTADDGFDKSTTAPLNVVVNAKPVARVVVTPSSGIPGTLVTMDGITSSDDGGSVTYLWTQTAGQPLGMGNPTTSAISFTAPTGVVTFRLVVNDGKQDSNPVSGSFSGSPPPSVSPSVTGVDTTVNPTFYGNSASYAAYGSTVTLNANPNGSGYTYVWRQINAGSDPVVSTLSSTTTQNPTFTVPSPTSTSGPFGQSPQATFGVIATEPTTQQSSPEVTVTVRFFASYNNQTVSQGSTVYSIISSRCTSCHFGTSNTYTGGSGNNAGFYGMGTATAFLNNSRGQNTYSSSSKKRLPTSSNAALGQSSSNAYTYDRITGTATTRMPSSGGYLNSADQYLIQDWIDQGVQNN
jgi:hypothetical protein